MKQWQPSVGVSGSGPGCQSRYRSGYLCSYGTTL